MIDNLAIVNAQKQTLFGPSDVIGPPHASFWNLSGATAGAVAALSSWPPLAKSMSNTCTQFDHVGSTILDASSVQRAIC